METWTLATLRRKICLLHATRIPLMLFGAPGSGKTASLGAFAREQGIGWRTMSLGQRAPEDMLGYPDLSSGRTVHRTPGIFPLEGDNSPDDGVLLLDDYGDAPRAVQAGAYELLCNRSISMHPIKSGWWIVLASNRPVDLSASEAVSFASANRCAVATLVPDMSDVSRLAHELNWSEPLKAYYSWAFAMKQELVQPNMQAVEAGDYAQPTNRTRGLLSKAIEHGATDEDYAMFVGTAEAVRIIEYVRLLSTLPTLQDILAAPKLAAVPDQLAAQYAVTVGLASHATVDLASTALIEPYVLRLSKPLQSYYRAVVRDRAPQCLNLPGWAEWAKKISCAPVQG